MNIFGLFISFAGVVLVVADFGNKADFSILGVGLLFLAVITGTIYGLGLKKLTEKYNSITITSYQNLIGIFLFLPLIIGFESKHLLDFTNLLTFDLALSLFNLALFASSIAFVLFAYGIQKIGPSKASVFSNSIPIFTLLFAYFVLGESITLWKIVGIAIVLLGLFLAQLKKRA